MKLALQLLPKAEPEFLDEVRTLLLEEPQQPEEQIPKYNYSTVVILKRRLHNPSFRIVDEIELLNEVAQENIFSFLAQLFSFLQGFGFKKNKFIFHIFFFACVFTQV